MAGWGIMKYVFFVFIFFSCFSQADTTLLGKGHVAHTQVEMHLQVDVSGGVKGYYFYLKSKKPIDLKGKIMDENIVLKTYANTKNKEKFIGKVVFLGDQISRISGKWFGRISGGKSVKSYDFKIDGI